MNACELLLNELESHMLVVQLVPLNPNRRGWNEGGCKRVPVDVPPAWYRKMCNRHASSRGVRRGGFDTRIKRANVLALLARLAAGRETTSKYRDELVAVAKGRMGL